MTGGAAGSAGAGAGATGAGAGSAATGETGSGVGSARSGEGAGTTNSGWPPSAGAKVWVSGVRGGVAGAWSGAPCLACSTAAAASTCFGAAGRGSGKAAASSSTL